MSITYNTTQSVTTALLAVNAVDSVVLNCSVAGRVQGTGGMVNTASGTRFESCTVNISDGSAHGGIACEAKDSTFVGCKSAGVVGGAVIVDVGQTDDSQGFGGICGVADGCTVSGCVNEAEVDIQNNVYTYVGGVVGRASACTISDVVNRGTVISTNEGANNNMETAGGYPAGLVGYLGASSLTRSVNYAEVRSIAGLVRQSNCDKSAGGIVGVITAGSRFRSAQTSATSRSTRSATPRP